MDTILSFVKSYSGMVAFGAGILGLIAGIIGVFIVIRGESLVGDAISHSALPGIAIAFLIVRSKNSLALMAGAAVSGLVALFIITGIHKYSKIKMDSLLALILSSFFGFGLILISYIQRNLTGHAGLESYIFGQAAGLVKRDIVYLLVVLFAILLALILFYKELKLFSFDPAYLTSIGYSRSKIGFILNLLTVMTIVVGLQMVGVVLMSAMLIAPASAAKLLSEKLSKVLGIAGLIGFLGGYFGTVLSFIYTIPTGPSIAVLLVGLVLLLILFAPKKGVVTRLFSKENQLHGGGI